MIALNLDEGNKVEHIISWGESTDPSQVGKAIEDVISKVKKQ